MPRPRVLKQAKIVPLVFEADLYEKLKEAASSKGLSVSAFVRSLVEKELSRGKRWRTGAEARA